MHRRPLAQALDAHIVADATEAAMLARTTEFVASNPQCFERSLAVGHVTGSAWIVDRGRNHVLLTHHRKLQLWLQLGGHCDGDADTCAVAMREAVEESGLKSIKLVSAAIFDVDVHTIPARRDEAEHRHYDIRYLFEADADELLVVSAESIALAWVGMGRLAALGADESVMRMAVKTGSRG